MSMSRVGASWHWRGWDAALWRPAAVPGTGGPATQGGFLPVDYSRAPFRGAAGKRLAFEGLHHHHHCKEKRSRAESTEN